MGLIEEASWTPAEDLHASEMLFGCMCVSPINKVNPLLAFIADIFAVGARVILRDKADEEGLILGSF